MMAIDAVFPGAGMDQSSGGMTPTVYLAWDPNNVQLLGIPRAPTMATGAAGSTQIATTSYVRAAITQFGGAAPGAGVDGGTWG